MYLQEGILTGIEGPDEVRLDQDVYQNGRGCLQTEPSHRWRRCVRALQRMVGFSSSSMI